MTYKQTYVVEYESRDNVPTLPFDRAMLGGKLYSVQFADAMAENELWRKHADKETRSKVDAILGEAWVWDR